MYGVVLAVAEALAVEGRITATVPHRTMLRRSEKVFGARTMGPPHNVGVVMYCAPLYLQI